MAGKLLLQLFSLLALLALGSFAQSESLVTVLRREGFTEFASALEAAASRLDLANLPNNLIVYAPTNAAILRQQLSVNPVRRRGDTDIQPGEYYIAKDAQSTGDRTATSTTAAVTTALKLRRRGGPVCNDVTGPGAVDFMTLLDDPRFVNLPPNNNASVVQKNMPKGALPVVHTGLGETVKVTGLDIAFNRGVIRPISGTFTFPRLLSVTLPFLAADKTLGVLQRTGLINDLDNRAGITFLAPDSSALAGLPDNVLAEILKSHVILGAPVFTSDLKNGDTYKTLAGTTVTVSVQCGDVFIGGARILSGDAIIKNGVVHTVDRLLGAPVFITTTEVKTVTETATKTAIQTAEVTKTAEITKIQTQTTEKTHTTTHTEEKVKTTTETAEITKVNTHTTKETTTQTETKTHVVVPPPPPPSPSTPCTTSTTVVPPPPPPPPPATPTPWQHTTLHTSHKPSKPYGPPVEVSTPCTTSTGRPGHY